MYDTDFTPAPAGWRNCYLNVTTGEVSTRAMPGWFPRTDSDTPYLHPAELYWGRVRPAVFGTGDVIAVVGPGDAAPTLTDLLDAEHPASVPGAFLPWAAELLAEDYSVLALDGAGRWYEWQDDGDRPRPITSPADLTRTVVAFLSNEDVFEPGLHPLIRAHLVGSAFMFPGLLKRNARFRENSVQGLQAAASRQQ